MRILCLHGVGNNSEIMKRNMSQVLQYCDVDWELHFLQGNEECSPAPGSSKYPGPYFCYSKSFAPTSQKLAHELVDKAITEQGPFDGVVGFSQGASILLAYFLEQMDKYPEKPLPIHFAIFCSPVDVLASDAKYCEFVFGKLSPENLSRLRSAEDDQIEVLPEPVQTMVSDMVAVLDEMEKVNRRPRTWFLDRQLMEIPCPLRPEWYRPRLPIPTLHVRASNDSAALNQCASVTESFCEPRNRRAFVHSAGHSFPKLESERKGLAVAFKNIAKLCVQSKL